MAVEFRWQRDDEHGSNEYVAVLPTDLGSEPASARRTLVIALVRGWNHSGGETGRCPLLERTVDLQEAPHSKLQYYVLGGSLVACAVVVGSLVLLVRRHSHKLQHIFRTLITEIAVLVAHLILETGDLGTDIYTWYRAVVDDSLGADEATKTAYSVLVAFALLASTVSVGYHIRLAWLLRQAAAAHLDDAAPATPRSADKAMLTKLKWEVDRSRREVTSHAITLLTVAIEDVRYAGRHSFSASARARKCGAHFRPFVRRAGLQVPFMGLNCSILFKSGSTGMPDRMERVSAARAFG
jgi:hypothetical protein